MKTATNRKKILNYFAGMENLASAIGNGGLADVGQPIVEGDVNIETPLSEQTQKKPRANVRGFFVVGLMLNHFLSSLILAFLPRRPRR
jgi:hypothetical protein